jgi:hypothetical protein
MEGVKTEKALPLNKFVMLNGVKHLFVNCAGQLLDSSLCSE